MPNRVIALSTTPQPILNEDSKAAEAILPGMLIDLNASGDTIKHLGGTTAVMPKFALEREEMGKDIDTPYAVNDTVKAGTFRSGNRVLAWIPSGANIAKSALLESNTAVPGTLRAVTTGVAIAKALEAVNNTAGPGNARIRVELM